jgi:hypothetical protein
MNPLSKNQSQRLFLLAFPALCCISLCLIVLTILPQSREWLRSVLISNSRVILGKVSGLVTAQGPVITVIKVKTADTLALEFFSQKDDSENQLFQRRIVLEERKDAHFNLKGRATNLALSDIDGDGTLELVAPTFDDDLIPRLNLFKYDPSRGEFLRLGPDNFNL